MMTGITNVGEGWRPLVRDLETELTALVPDYSLQQVKEKFGGLRYYAAVPNATPAELVSQFHARISAAETESFKICEVCGDDGFPDYDGGYWIKTLCVVHHAERVTKRAEESR